MAYNDDIQRTTTSLGSPEGSVNPRMWGDDTLSFAAKNHPSNTETASNRNSNPPAEYGKTKTNVTASGHVLQFNDTPAGERVLLKHNTGSAVDMLPDGSVEISSRGNMSITINKDGEIVVLSVDTADETLEGFVKGRLNYKKVELNNFKAGRTYTVPVRIAV